MNRKISLIATLTTVLSIFLFAYVAAAGPYFTASLNYGETVDMEPLGAVVTFADVVEDTRCPLHTLCTDGGAVEIRLDVEYPMLERPGPQIILLRLDPDEPRANTALLATGFTVELNQVDPYPRNGDPTPLERYTIELGFYRAGSRDPGEEAAQASVSKPSNRPQCTVEILEVYTVFCQDNDGDISRANVRFDGEPMPYEIFNRGSELVIHVYLPGPEGSLPSEFRWYVYDRQHNMATGSFPS